jgi:hypothetical protein
MPERKSHGRSKAGVELTDDVLERMAGEAEEGLDITKLLRRPGRPAMGSAPAESFRSVSSPSSGAPSTSEPPRTTRRRQTSCARCSAGT